MLANSKMLPHGSGIVDTWFRTNGGVQSSMSVRRGSRYAGRVDVLCYLSDSLKSF